MRFAIDISGGRLFNGRRSFYASVNIGRRTWFVSRWDTPRVYPLRAGQRTITTNPEMTWYCGAREVA